MQIKTTMRYNLTLVRMAIYHKIYILLSYYHQKIINAEEGMVYYTIDGNVN